MTDERYTNLMIAMWTRTLQYSEISSEARRRNEDRLVELRRR